MITRLTEPDRPAWSALWRDYLAFYKTELPDEIYDHTWSRLMKDTEIHGLAFRTEAGIVGIVHFLYHPSAWTLTPVCYLQDLYVAEQARGQGAARALIEAVATHARTRQSARLYWLTQDHNATARHLYDRLAKHTGFIRYEYPPL